MIKNILLICFNLIIIVAIVFSLTKGWSISDKYQIMSYKQIGEIQQKYKDVIEERDNIKNTEYNYAINNLDLLKENYKNVLKNYDSIKEITSKEELIQISRDVEYRIESLWIKLDLPAKNNNLKANFQLLNMYGNIYTINVTLEGDYLAIKNYIYDIMIDMDLQFKSENIIVEKQEGKGKATFQINNVKILM